MWPQHLGPILTGAAGLVVALTGLLAARPRRISAQLQECIDGRAECEQDSELYQQQVLTALRHIFKLEKALTLAGKKPPPRPEGLDL